MKVLIKEIKSLQKRDYTLKMIAEILTAHELDISESVLKSYLKRAEEKSTAEATTEESKSTKAKEVEAAKAAAQAANEEANPATAPKNTDATRNKPNNFVDV